MKATARLTNRDFDLLASLWRDPKTIDQVFAESRIYPAPFRSRHRTKVRLLHLFQAGYLHRWRYAHTGNGSAPYYYKLSPKGFRSLCDHLGEDLPRPRFDQLRNPVHHRHLADCNVQTFVAAHAAGIPIEHFAPDGVNRFRVADGDVVPDSTYIFALPSGQQYTFFFEVDNSTESLVSASPASNTIEQKILQYEQHFFDLHEEFRKRNSDDQFICPFRVVFFCSRSRTRKKNIIDLARRIVSEPERNLIYAVYLPDYLASRDPLTDALFLNNKFRKNIPLFG